MVEDDPDAELLARVARSEPQAVREMVARKLPRLLSLAQRLLGRRDEAQEVAQETFLRVWKQAGHWTPGLARFEVVCPLQIYAGDKVTLVHSLTVEQVKVFCGDKDPLTTKGGES